MPKIIILMIVLGLFIGCTQSELQTFSKDLQELGESCHRLSEDCRKQSAISRGWSPYSGESLSSFEQRQEEERRHREILYEMRRQSDAQEEAVRQLQYR